MDLANREALAGRAARPKGIRKSATRGIDDTRRVNVRPRGHRMPFGVAQSRTS